MIRPTTVVDIIHIIDTLILIIVRTKTKQTKQLVLNHQNLNPEAPKPPRP